MRSHRIPTRCCASSRHDLALALRNHNPFDPIRTAPLAFGPLGFDPVGCVDRVDRAEQLYWPGLVGSLEIHR
jgi:hypothetical protein